MEGNNEGKRNKGIYNGSSLTEIIRQRGASNGDEHPKRLLLRTGCPGHHYLEGTSEELIKFVEMMHITRGDVEALMDAD